MERVAERVNDIHSRLNATSVSRIARPRDIEALQAEIREAGRRRQGVAVSGDGSQAFVAFQRVWAGDPPRKVKNGQNTEATGHSRFFH